MLIIILRIILGITFLCSACFKLISIDEFELYIFSHNIFSLNFSFIIARLVISFEFFIGIMLILKLYFKKIWIISVLALILFTIYLSIIAISSNTGNCHCFGEFLEMTPLESIFKNLLLLLLFFFIRKEYEFQFKYKLPLTLALLFVSIALPIIVSPPDFLYKKEYSIKTIVNENGLDSIIFKNNNFPEIINSEKKILCFYSPACKFCKLSEKKISSIVSRHKLDSKNFLNIFWGNPEHLEAFYSGISIKHESVFIQAQDFLHITEGKMPLILLIENHTIKEKFGYRNIDEDIIVNFLSN